MGTARRLAGCVVSLCTCALCTAVASLAPALGGERAERGVFDLLRRGPGIVNHPVGVVPSAGIRIPAGWPLDSDGTITCLTCHAAIPDLSFRNDPQLRCDGPQGSRSLTFCGNCHDAGQSGGKHAMHWLAVPRAHVLEFGTELAGNENGLAQPTDGDPLDSESRRCLECHDGVSASDRFAGGNGLADADWNHPVGIAYATGRDAEVTLRPPSELPPLVRLPGGRVSCVSCHNLYAGSDHLLSVTLERSTLCFVCHRLDP
ncbi:MAG: hypothetical protein C4547_06100 [Phycisphaerales bacterium]|nr:MAG: hypothetical protein C4547_06100 [Phycisphaerales bacterium]